MRASALRGAVDVVEVFEWGFEPKPVLALAPNLARGWDFLPVVLEVAAFAAGVAFKLSVGRLVSVMDGLVGWQGVGNHHYIG